MKKKIILLVTMLFMLIPQVVMAEEARAYGSFQTAMNIGVNTKIYDSLTDSSDENYYKFVLPSDGYISLNFGKEYDSDTYHGWKVCIYNAAQKEIMNRIIYAGNTAESKTCNLGLSAGTYYIKVTKPYFSAYTNVGYSIKVNYAIDSLWEKEQNANVSNDEVAGANGIQTNTQYNGSILEYNDEDHYAFTLSEAGVVNLAFAKEYDERTGRGWKIILYDANIVPMMERSFYAGTTEMNMCGNIGLSAGTYYVKVECVGSGSYWTDVDYKLTVNYTGANNWEKESDDKVYNNTPLGANDVLTDVMYYGTLSEYSDVDYFRFTAPEDGYVNLTFGKELVNKTSLGWKVLLYDVNQGELASYEIYTGNTNEQLTSLIKIQSGTYYMKVTCIGSGSYWTPATYNFKINYRYQKVTAINLSESTKTITVGDNFTLGTSVSPDNALIKDVNFTSDNEEIATVDSNGKVTGKKMGTTVIRVSALDGSGVTNACTVTVRKSCVVSFNSNYGSSVSSQTIMSGTTAKKPSNPRRTGYIFTGWYTDYYCTKIYIFSTTVNDNMTLYAGWYKKGEKIKVGKGYYKILSSSTTSGTVAYVGPVNTKTKSVTIPSTVKINGKTYKVTTIAANAFNYTGNAYLTKIVIGKNVTKIGKQAFKNCKNLKTLTVKSAKIKKVEANAFNGVKKKVTVTVPKKQYKKYKSLFKKAELKKVTYKKS